MVRSRALVTNNPGSLKPDSRDPETETGNLETEKRVHRIHCTLETGLHMIPRSLVAPSRGAGGFMNNLLVSVDYSWIIHRYLWIMHGEFEKLSVCFFTVASDGFLPEGDFPFWNLKTIKNEKHANTKHLAESLSASGCP